jgi:hemerythrin
MIWNPDWETGVPLIDQQHRQLLAQLERLFQAVHDDRAAERMPDLLAFLADYVETHFSDEELHMQVTDYPDFLGHKAIHDDLRARVEHLVEAFQQDQAVVTDAVIDFLTDWLVNHIDVEDRRMALHLNRFNHADARRDS